MPEVFYRLWALLFARPAFRKLHVFLLQLGIRGLGVLNYYSPRTTGEHWLVHRFLADRWKHLDEEITVFDVGANCGAFTRDVLGVHPRLRVMAFEPHPAHVAELSRRYENDPRVRVEPLAISDSEGRSTLYDYPGPDTASEQASLNREAFESLYSEVPARELPISLTTLDLYCQAHPVSRIHLLKLDVEGHEPEALRGAARLIASGAVEVVLFEFNAHLAFKNTTMLDFFRLLPGYELYRLLPSGLLRLPKNAPVLNTIYQFQNILALRSPSS